MWNIQKNIWNFCYNELISLLTYLSFIMLTAKNVITWKYVLLHYWTLVKGKNPSTTHTIHKVPVRWRFVIFLVIPCVTASVTVKLSWIFCFINYWCENYYFLLMNAACCNRYDLNDVILISGQEIFTYNVSFSFSFYLFLLHTFFL